jgi:hypothetical protein
MDPVLAPAAEPPPSNSQPTPAQPTLIRGLNLLDSVLLLVSGIIGSSIFLTAKDIAGPLPQPMLFLLVWVIGGVVSLFGCVAFAELGSMFPESGGQYIYLREAYGDSGCSQQKPSKSTALAGMLTTSATPSNSAGTTTGIGTKPPGARATSRSSGRPAASLSTWTSPPTRRTSNSSKAAGKKITASSAAGSYSRRKTMSATALAIPMATTGCVRSATRNFGSARISSRPHTLTLPSSRRWLGLGAETPVLRSQSKFLALPQLFTCLRVSGLLKNDSPKMTIL